MLGFSDIFKLKNSDNNELALMYSQGLLAANKRNIERMDERICESQYDRLHHFVSHSPWSSRDLMDRTAERAYNLLREHSHNTDLPLGAYLDESSFAKKGIESVGVSRQWLGCKGKVDNGQVAVFSAFGSGPHCALVDCRLFLPESWTNDPVRCEKARIPEDQRTYKTKIELALESVEHLNNKGFDVDFYAVDALYGSSMAFMNSLELNGKPVLGRVRQNFKFFLSEPEFYLPEKKSNRGRTPKKMRTDTKRISAFKLQQESNEDEWQTLEVRETERGTLKLDVLYKKIWIHCEKSNAVISRKILITRENEDKKVKYSYTLVIDAGCTDLRRLVQMDRQRYWIERSFQDAKNEAGLDEYQVRKFEAFYHHMSLSMLAYLYITEQRMNLKEDLEFLSCADIKKWVHLHFAAFHDTFTSGSNSLQL